MYADIDFKGNLIKDYANNDAVAARSWYGWIITYVYCPNLWISAYQTQVALIPQDAISINILIFVVAMEILCHDFDDNSGELELAKLSKIRP